MLLQSFNEYAVIAYFNPRSGEIIKTQRKPRTADGLITETCGHYSVAFGGAVALYAFKGLLHLCINKTNFPLTDDVKAELVRNASRGMFSLKRETTLLVKIIYQPILLDPPLSFDPTPFVEEEDFDFFLLVHNIINKPERKQVYLESRQKCGF